MVTAQRENDVGVNTWFRSDRFSQQNGKWFFLTREGSVEGPFDFRRAAENRLEDYIKVMNSGMMPSDSGLSMLPRD